MYKIGIDYRLANTSLRGMARYCREIVFQLVQMDDSCMYYLYVDSELEDPFLHMKKNVVVRRFPSANYIIGEQMYIPYYICKDHLNVFWSPYNTFPLYKPKNCKLLVTIHDLIFFSSLYSNATNKQKIGTIYRRFCLSLGYRNIDQCLTVSEFSQRDIEHRFGIKDVKITYNCIDSFYSKVKERGVLKKRSDFYFTVTGDAPSKNLDFVLEYFSIRPDKRLVIAGVSKDAKIRGEHFSNIEFLPPGVPDEVLIDKYLSCKVFLFLSLQEGFGIPLLEALICGCPIIASNRTSIPEVVGNNGILVDPGSIEELDSAMTKIENVYIDYTYRLRYMEKFLHWKNSAKIVSICFNNLC